MDGCRIPFRYSGKNGHDLERQICRQFINGSCRYGQRCYYLHEWPMVPSAQVCRYFQKGGCWFGDNCRYLHIPHTSNEASGARRGSAPVVHSSFTGHTLTDRRGSEPSLAVQGARGSSRRRSEPLIPNYISQQQRLQHPAVGIAEEEEDAATEARPIPNQQAALCAGGELPLQSDCAGPSHSRNSECVSMSNTASVEVQEKTDKQETSLQDGLEMGATAQEEQMEAYRQSKDVCCGICMDKVYDKSTEGERRFGILPNCIHAFCLSCIMTWRKTKEFQEDVIKACPQCRVKSTFYIPSKYWVYEDEPKAALISAFKEKSSQIKCKFFMHRGCCPFGVECIFSHDLPPGHRPQRQPFRPKSAAELLDQRILSYFIALTLFDDEDFLDEIEIF